MLEYRYWKVFNVAIHCKTNQIHLLLVKHAGLHGGQCCEWLGFEHQRAFRNIGEDEENKNRDNVLH